MSLADSYTPCPKPPKRSPRSPARIPRTAPPKTRNAARQKREFARAYGSEARVEWIKARPCRICRYLPSENVHTETGGAGRKADASTITNLCRLHHLELHEFGAETFQRNHNVNLAELAAATERAWRSHVETTR